MGPKLTSYQVLAGAVSLHTALGSARGLTRVAAWVIPYRLDSILACAEEPPSVGTVPTDASMLDAVIITGPDLDDVTIYSGAGTMACVPRTSPLANNAALLQGTPP